MDGTGCVVSETDALGGTTVYTHDALLRTLTKTNALGGTKSYTYDKYGNALTETNEAGQTTTYEYDIIGNKIADITPDGRKIRYEYDSNGRNTKITLFLYNGQLGVMTNEKIVLEVIDRIFQNWYST